MNKEEKNSLIITIIICLLPILIGLILYNKLPNEIPIHFDINNEPNSYFSKPLFVFGMPILMAFLQFLACLKDAKKNINKEANRKATKVFKWIIPIIGIIMYITTILYALGNALDIRKVVMLILGILFIVVGNYVPKTVNGTTINIGFMNWLNGVAYKKVSHIAGYMFIINGILFIGSILFNKYISIAVLILLIIEVIILSIYSIIKDKDLKQNK